MRRMFVILALEVEESLVQGQSGLTMSPYLNHKTHLKKKMQERKEKELHLSLAWNSYQHLLWSWTVFIQKCFNEILLFGS